MKPIPGKFRVKRCFVGMLSIVISCQALACGNGQELTGTWESTQLIISMHGKPFVKNIDKNDFQYSKMVFADSSLTFYNKDTIIGPTTRYRLQRDTLWITASNGSLSAVPVMKHTGKALHLRHLNAGDSVVGVYRKVD